MAALAEVSGASFIGLDTVTTPTLTGGKKNPLQGRIRKIMSGASVMVFQNKNSNGYENMVQKRLVAEGKDATAFELSPRPWGVRVPNTPIVEHKGKEYLEVIFLKAGEVQFTCDDKPIDRDDIQGLDESPSGEQGNLQNKVIIRTFAMDSLRAVRINKDTITL